MNQVKALAFGVTCLLLSACGVSETAVTATAVAKGQAQQAEQAKQQMDQFQKQLDAANKQADAQRAAAESAAQ